MRFEEIEPAECRELIEHQQPRVTRSLRGQRLGQPTSDLVQDQFGLPMDEDWGTEPRIEATRVPLRDVLTPRKTSITYTYDIGDGWEHRFTLSNTRPGEPGVSYPRYIAGQGNAPPEDCGGIPGFYEKLDIAADPGQPDFDEIKEWLGDYDRDSIDERQIKINLGRISKQKSTAKPRLKTPES